MNKTVDKYIISGLIPNVWAYKKFFLNNTTKENKNDCDRSLIITHIVKKKRESLRLNGGSQG